MLFVVLLFVEDVEGIMIMEGFSACASSLTIYWSTKEDPRCTYLNVNGDLNISGWS